MTHPLTLFAVSEADACGDEPGVACRFVYRQTDNEVLAGAVDWLIARPLKILFILVLALVANALAQRAVRHFVEGINRSALRRRVDQPPQRAHQRTETIGVVLRGVAKVVIATMAVLLVLGELEINLGPLLAGAGIVGVAVGFGAQTLVRDFLAGIFMLIEDQYGVGDVIDTGSATGVVEGVSLRTTRVRDDEGTLWHVPNGEIKRIGNRSQRA